MSMPQNKEVILERFAHTPHGVFGRLIVGDVSVFTVERPWLNNKQKESCIPEGTYPLRLRFSPVVQRSSQGAFNDGWEIGEVPNRTFIMIHPGNNMYDVIGCVAVGLDLGFIRTSRSPKAMWAVTDSQAAFKKVMAALDKENEWEIVVRSVGGAV